MKPFPAILLALAAPLAAQDIAPKDSERDPILTELLDDAASTVTVDQPAEPDAMLVTGNPPADAQLVEHHEEEARADEPEPVEIPVPEEPKGVQVSVQGGSPDVSVESSDVKILFPFPAKPLSEPPAGWRLTHPESVPALSQPVTLPNGTRVTLSIRPHVLVPDADGSTVFGLKEPGYEAARGYAQTDTVGAVLADSINELDVNNDRLAAASRRLTELLDSLPQPVAETAAQEP